MPIVVGSDAAAQSDIYSAVTLAGASPSSASVLDEIFGFPEVGVHEAAKTVGTALVEASVETTTLEIANRIFPDIEFSPSPEFLDTAVAYYGVGLQPVDTGDAGAAANTINDWVSETTRGLIPVIVDADAVEDQSLIMVNTVYLKADWVSPFDPGLTSDSEFTTAEGTTVSVPFMRDRSYRRFVRLDNADAVELPYERRDLAMWLIVPHDEDGPATVEASMSAGSLTELGGIARTGDVSVRMPKWEQALPPTDLCRWLCPLGLCAGARFDNIGPKVEVTAALHSAKLIVDEMGTEAAAATAIGGYATSETPPPRSWWSQIVPSCSRSSIRTLGRSCSSAA